MVMSPLGYIRTDVVLVALFRHVRLCGHGHHEHATTVVVDFGVCIERCWCTGEPVYVHTQMKLINETRPIQTARCSGAGIIQNRTTAPSYGRYNRFVRRGSNIACPSLASASIARWSTLRINVLQMTAPGVRLRTTCRKDHRPPAFPMTLRS